MFLYITYKTSLIILPRGIYGNTIIQGGLLFMNFFLLQWFAELVLVLRNHIKKQLRFSSHWKDHGKGQNSQMYLNTPNIPNCSKWKQPKRFWKLSYYNYVFVH